MELSGAISRCHGPLGESSSGPSSSIEQKLLALPGVLLPSTSSKAAKDSLSKLPAMSFADWMLRKCSNQEQSRSFASLVMHLVAMAPKNRIVTCFGKDFAEQSANEEVYQNVVYKEAGSLSSAVTNLAAKNGLAGQTMQRSAVCAVVKG